MSQPNLLIGDIGGTNARFALGQADRVGFSDAATLDCAAYPTPVEAIRTYLNSVQAGEPAAICLAAAGPVVEETIRLTNNHWLLDAAELRREFAAANVRLLNDFEAVSRSMPFLRPTDVLPVGASSGADLHAIDGADAKGFTVAVIGPGTGLGMGGLRRHGRQYDPVICEGGQAGFAPETDRQLQLIIDLRQHLERVTVESLVSGPGLRRIHAALGRLRGTPPADLNTQAIFETGMKEPDSPAGEAVQLFFEMLGQIAGDLALYAGAVDGVYIAGGIIPRYPAALRDSNFRAAFEAKGSHRGLMEQTPTWLVTYPEPGLLGAASVVGKASRRE